MNITLWESPRDDVMDACSEFFYGCEEVDDEADSYIGLAGSEDVAAASGFFEFLAKKLGEKADAIVVRTDYSEEYVLALPMKNWDKHKEIQNSWSEIIATPLEHLFHEAELIDDRGVRELALNYWDMNDIAGRCDILRVAGPHYITHAILDEPPPIVIDKVIEHQIEYLLS